MYHICFIHSFVNGHPGCFHVLAVVYSAAVNTGVTGVTGEEGEGRQIERVALTYIHHHMSVR